MKCWLAATLVIVAATYALQLDAPFELQDDHRIIAPVIRPHSGAISMYRAEIRSDFEHVGRFRPVNQLFDVIGPVILGPRPMLWHALSLALAIVVAALLFHAGHRAFESSAAGAVFALVTLLAPDPGPTAAWYRLGPKEAWGMLFLATALVLMVARRSRVLTFVFIALSAYSKESFLLLLPALWMLQVRIDSGRGRVRIFLTYALLFGLGLVAVFVAVRGAGAGSYGGQSLSRSSGEVASVLLADARRAPQLAVWFVPFLLGLTRRRPRLMSVVIFLAWVGPQFALYATRGGFWDHYWLPCVVAFAAANAWGVSVLDRKLRAVALAVFALWTLNAMRIDVMSVLNHREKARVQQEAVRVVAERIGAGEDLVIAHDPSTQSEIAPAFAAFVEARGARFRRAILHDSHQMLPAAPIVVYLDDQQTAPREGYERLHVHGRRRYLSLRQRGWVSIPFGLQIDVRRDD